MQRLYWKKFADKCDEAGKFLPDKWYLPIPEDNYYDKEKADRAVTFIENLEHYKGEYAGYPIRLMPWQEYCVIRPLFGMMRPSGLRQYRRGYIQLARKNGKTTLGAPISNYMFFADGESGPEVYYAASARDQASKLFRAAREMVKSNSALDKLARIKNHTKEIFHEKDGGAILKALSKDADVADGADVHCAIFDELHTQDSPKLFEVLEDATDAREEPLMLSITYAGVSENSICYEEYDYSKKVLEGVVNDPSHFTLLCSCETAIEEDDEDWHDSSVWIEANPGLVREDEPKYIEEDGQKVPNPNRGFKRGDNLEEKAKKAKKIPRKKNNFLRKHLNIWTQSETRFIDKKAWDACGKEDYAEHKLHGLTAYGGLDLSTKKDLTAWVLIVPVEGRVYVLPRAFCPAENLFERSETDGVPYVTWLEQGLINKTEGNIIDTRHIEDQIEEDMGNFDVRSIGYDRWNSTDLMIRLEEKGLDVNPINQTYSGLSAGTKKLESLVLSETLRHNNHKPLSWCADNMVVDMDSNENVKPNKKKSNERIDLMVALVMAVDQMMRGEKDEHTKSVYEDRGVITVG